MRIPHLEGWSHAPPTFLNPENSRGRSFILAEIVMMVPAIVAVTMVAVERLIPSTGSVLHPNDIAPTPDHLKKHLFAGFF